jgi:Family of unknown function (DUF6111)
MLRVFLTIVLPLLLPTAIYVAWLVAMQWSARGSDRESAGGAAQGEGVHWTALPWIWLAAAGVVLLVLVLLTVTVHFGEPETGTYVPPRYEGGRVVPGHIEPRRAP